MVLRRVGRRSVCVHDGLRLRQILPPSTVISTSVEFLAAVLRPEEGEGYMARRQ